MLGKIFKAYDVRATYPDPLNEVAAWKVGYAAGQYLSRTSGLAGSGRVLVSRDMRPHSPSLAGALCEGLRAAGPDVVDLGMCDTSFIYFAINHLDNGRKDVIGGIQTTASHNPIEYNGFKISGREARPIGADTGLKEIQAIAENLPANLGPGSLEPAGKYERCDLWKPYREYVLRFLDPLPRPLRIVIDASNGMAGKLVPAVFEGIDNLEIIPINFEITGSFVHEPNPLVAENMVPTQEAVRQRGADLGACFDGDADRCMITDEKGAILGCDHLTALLCRRFLDQAPGAAVVYDLRSSKVVPQQIEALGGRPVRSRVGHVFMKALLREHQGIFGGELSGHFYFRDNAFADSGAIALASLLSMLGRGDRPLSAMVDPFRRYPQSGEINYRVADKQAVLDGLKSKYADVAAIDELDGVTIDAFDARGWWFNVRASNTEPLLRLNAEAADRDKLTTLLQEIRPLLGEPAQGH